MTTQIETRTVPATELLVAGDGRTITGYAAVFGSDSLDMGYTETIRRGCFADSLKRDQVKNPVLCLWNHNSDMPLGTTANGSLELEEDSRGLKFKVRPGKTSYAKDAREAIAAGLVQGCSFGFTIQKDKWTDDGLRREIIEADLREVSPCVFPAYPQTEVQARNAQRSRQMNQLEKMQLAARELIEAIDNPDERKTLPFAMNNYDQRAAEANWPTIEERGLEYILEFFRTNGKNDPEESKRVKSTLEGKYSAEVPLALRINPQDDGNAKRDLSTETKKMSTHSRSFRGMFHPRNTSITLDDGGFKSAREFLDVIESGRFDPRLQERAAMVEGIGSSGGWSVPMQYVQEWLDASLPQEIVRNHCRVFPMEGSEITVPGWDAGDMSGGSLFGGFAMEFLGESAEGTKQTAKMRKIMMKARTGAIYVDASLELAEDGRGFAEQLQSALIKSIGYGIDSHCISGVGSGAPLGLRNAGCKIQVPAEVGQGSSSLIYANLKKMFARQLNPENAVWLFNSSAIPELLEQSVAVGTSGSHVPILDESNGEFRIFGKKCFFTPHMPALGSADDCAFVDFSFYGLGLRQDIAIDITDAHRWTQRERSYRVLIRWDAQPLLDAAVTPENGDTLSPIVTLAAR